MPRKEPEQDKGFVGILCGDQGKSMGQPLPRFRFPAGHFVKLCPTFPPPRPLFLNPRLS